MRTLFVRQDFKSFFPRPQKVAFLYFLFLLPLSMPTTAAPLEKVTLQSCWFHQFQFADLDFYSDKLLSNGALLYLFIIAILVICGLSLSVVAIFIRMNRKLIHESNARILAIAEMEERERNLRFITENSADVIWAMDLVSGKSTYVSPSVYNLLGYTAEEIMTQMPDALMTPESSTRAWGSLTESIKRWNEGDHGDTRKVTEIDQYHKNGQIISTEVVTTLHTDGNGKLTSLIGISRDISERKKVESAIRNLAFYDSLTNLPNRRLLLDRLEQAITQAKRNQLRMALMFIDLDKFKPVNDRYGHETGDWLLKAVAIRMQTCLRESDTAARIGGDEFIVLLPEIQKNIDAKLVAEKIRNVLNQPFEMESGVRLNISACIGIAIYPDHGVTEKQLMKNGDTAMYQAKESGRNRVWIYQRSHDDAPLNEGALMRLNWKRAYESGEPNIDEEHRELFHLAGDVINSAIDRDENPTAFDTLFKTLLSHIEKHFVDEEAILSRYQYDDREAHVSLHRELLQQAYALYDASVSEDKLSISALIDFIIDDLVKGHLIKADRKFYPLFKKNK